jgi:uncharacterized protein (TIGR00297 family)
MGIYSIWLLLGAQVFSITVGALSYKKGSISFSGLLALLVISSLFIWLQEIAMLFVVFYMFASSSILSKYKKSQKTDIEKVVAKTGGRDYIQALANLGTAAALTVVYHFFPQEILLAAILGTVATANADSWASEIGGLSKQKPVLITTLKPIQKGLSGGITLMGTLGGVAGSLFLVLMSVLTIQWLSPFTGNLTILVISSFIAGSIGFMCDSLLGAYLQALYKHPLTLLLTEKHSKNAELVKGFPWIDNDMINFITTVIGALLGGSLYWILS